MKFILAEEETSAPSIEISDTLKEKLVDTALHERRQISSTINVTIELIFYVTNIEKL